LTYDRITVEICPKSGFSAGFAHENKTMAIFDRYTRKWSPAMVFDEKKCEGAACNRAGKGSTR